MDTGVAPASGGNNKIIMAVAVVVVLAILITLIVWLSGGFGNGNGNGSKRDADGNLVTDEGYIIMVDSEDKIIKDNEDKPILFDKDEGKIINNKASNDETIVYLTREELENELFQAETDADNGDEDAAEMLDTIEAVLASLELLEKKYVTGVSATANTVTETSVVEYPTDTDTGYTIMVDEDSNNFTLDNSGPLLYDKSTDDFVSITENGPTQRENVLIFSHVISTMPDDVANDPGVGEFIDTANKIIESFKTLTERDLNEEYEQLTPEKIKTLFNETGPDTETEALGDPVMMEDAVEEPSVNTTMDEPEVEPIGDRDCVMGEWREWQETESAKNSLCLTTLARTRAIKVEPMGNGQVCGKRIQTKCTAINMDADEIKQLEAAATAAAHGKISEIQEMLESKKLELKNAKNQAKRDAEAAMADLEAANKEAKAAQKESADIQAQLDNARERIENKKRMIRDEKDAAKLAKEQQALKLAEAEQKRKDDIARVRQQRQNAAAKAAAAAAAELQSALDAASAAAEAQAAAEQALVKSQEKLAKSKAKTEALKAELKAAEDDAKNKRQKAREAEERAKKNPTPKNKKDAKNAKDDADNADKIANNRKKEVDQAKEEENKSQKEVNDNKKNNDDANKRKNNANNNVNNKKKRNEDAKNKNNDDAKNKKEKYMSSTFNITGMNI